MSRCRSLAALLLLTFGAAACADRVPTGSTTTVGDAPQLEPRLSGFASATQSFLITPVGLDFGDVQTGTNSATQVVTVKNVSGAPQFIDFAGGAATGFNATQSCAGVTLPANGTCSVFYSYSPTTVGPASSVGNGSVNGQLFNIALRANGVGARFRITSTGLDFGDVQVGTSQQLVVTLTNIGLAPVVGDIAGGGAGAFGGSQNCQGVTIAVGASCQLFYTFIPTDSGVVTGGTNGSLNGQPFAFTMRGHGVLPSFRISPTSIDFGQVRVGQSVQVPVTLTNTGTRPVVGDIAGGGAGAFGGSQNCQGITIPVGGSCQLFYTFIPSAPGTVTGSTNGSLNGQQFSISFAGTGIAQNATLTTPFRIVARALDFGDQQIGTSVTLQIDFTNISGAPIVGSIAGGGAGAFGGSQNCQGVTIPAGGSCQLFYAFNPTVPGEVTGSTNGALNGQPFAITFRGNGIRPSFRVTPSSIDFGRVQTGRTLTLPVTLTNVGRAAVVGDIAGGGAGAFGGSQNCQSVTIPVGGSCQLFYTFSPTTAGVVTGSTNGALNGYPFSFSFTGTGVAPSFRVTPFAFDFGEVLRGSVSPTQQVNVTNTGLAPVLMDIAGGGAGVFGGAQNCQSITLAVGASCQVFYQFIPTIVGPVTATTNGALTGQPFAFSFMGTGLGPEESIDIAPATISLANTPSVSVVLLSSPSFNAVTVTLGNVRLLVNGGIEVAPVSRGGVVTSSLRDWNNDGFLDRMFSFRTSDLVAAGLTASPTVSTLVLFDRVSTAKWSARDLALPTIVP